MKILIKPETEQEFLAIPDGTTVYFYDGVLGTWEICKKSGTKLTSIYNKIRDTINIDELDFEYRGDGSFWYYEYENPDGK